jgi:hypothetical protein
MTAILRPTNTPEAVNIGELQANVTPVPPQETMPVADAGALNRVAGENGGRVISVSEELPSYPASRLIDGYKLDGGEWWTGEYPEFPHAVVFELAGDRVWTSEWRYGWVKDFQIYISSTSPDTDDMGWVGSFTLLHVGADQEFTFAPAEARYVVFAFAGDGTYTVDQVVLNPYSDGYEEDWIQGFSVWGSDTSPDLASMWNLGEFTLAQVGEDQAFAFDPVTLRYIALIPTSNHGGTEYALNEFEVYEVGAVTGGGTGGVQAIGTLNQAAEAVEGIEIEAKAAPEITEGTTGIFPRTIASSGESPLDNIEYKISLYDLVPVIYHLYGTYFDDLLRAAANYAPDGIMLWATAMSLTAITGRGTQ